jgi:hypothetical protein
MKNRKSILAILAISVVVIGCKGGGGGSSSSNSGGGTGSISVSQGANVGISCMGYELDLNKCQNITGSWNSVAVPDVYGCVGATNALKGSCNIGSKKFTGLTAIPYSNEAVTVCEDFGGSITPTTSLTCSEYGGSWQIVTAATTAYSCSITPTSESDCDAAGGIYGNIDSLLGRATHQGSADLPKGINTLQTGEDMLNSYDFNPGTSVAAITGTITLANVYGPMTDYWRTAASVKRSGEFLNNRYDNTLDLKVYFGEAYEYEDYNNGAYLDLTIYYIKD